MLSGGPSPAAPAVLWCRWLFANVSTCAFTVLHVVVLGAYVQVVRVNAESDIAPMVDLFPLRDRAVSEHPREPVGVSFRSSKSSVASRDRRPSPKPTSIGLADFRPEPSLNRLCMSFGAPNPCVLTSAKKRARLDLVSICSKRPAARHARLEDHVRFYHERWLTK